MCLNGSVQATLEAVANPRRREILRLIWSAELSAGEIASHFDVTWPAVSQNLRVLRSAGLVTERREGNRRLYRANRRALRPLEPVLRRMWTDDLARLKGLAERESTKGRGRWKSRARSR
jgi:DNA-binding transcriptional ArsR family regulator